MRSLKKTVLSREETDNFTDQTSWIQIISLTKRGNRETREKLKQLFIKNSFIIGGDREFHDEMRKKINQRKGNRKKRKKKTDRTMANRYRFRFIYRVNFGFSENAQ